MTINSDVPLIHASVGEPLILAAKKIGTPIEKVLQSVKLTTRVLDEPFLLIPLIPLWNLAHTIGAIEAEPLFGLKATTELAVYRNKSLEPLLPGCINLRALLERFCKVSPTICSADNYIFKEAGDTVWFMQKGVRVTDDYKQAELFTISLMIQLVQRVAGDNWRPTAIHCMSPYCHHINNSPLLNPSKIFYSKLYPAIAMPRHLLALEIPKLKSAAKVAGGNHISLPPKAIEDRLLQAIIPYIGETPLNPKLVSEITGMSFRTLQRKLSNNGTHYSTILRQARFQKAQVLLRDTIETISNISSMLGYENISAFSRAFKRWAGVSPQEYRKAYTL